VQALLVLIRVQLFGREKLSLLLMFSPWCVFSTKKFIFAPLMAIEKITIEQFLQLRGRYPVLDVRSPGEYNHAHIPGAYSLPLFTDEERKVVGTIYKQVNKEAAIKKGLEYFGPKMVNMIDIAEKIMEEYNISTEPKEKAVIVHCWRGGMRSAGVAWLLGLYGFKVYTIVGGYKYFRRWCIAQFEKEYSFKVIGGYTGSGKTAILNELKQRGSKIIDLEAIARHKGSAFGNLQRGTQPTQEMFENILALELACVEKDITWIEDESQRIGDVNIPAPLHKSIQNCPLYFLEIPFEKRLQYIIDGYGKFEKEALAEAIIRIKKRLGGLETKTALAFLEEDDLHNCFGILLKYYDKQYLKCLRQKDEQFKPVKKIVCEDTDAIVNTRAMQKEQAFTEIKVN